MEKAINKKNKEEMESQESFLKKRRMLERADGFLSGFKYHAKGDIVVDVDNVLKDFILGNNKVNVLNGVNFKIKRGEFVMLMGPSGCGKSTLLHIIYGLEPTTKGTVYVEDENIWEHSKSWRAFFRNQYIGFIPQQAFWLKSLSVVENVAVPGFIGGKKYRESIKRAYKTLEVVEMEKWAHYRPLDLSGGQQQKVAFARSLLLNPKFIIADEPTGNLDQQSGIQLMTLIKEINESLNITVLMVTHNPKQTKYASRVINMMDGKIVSDLNSQEEDNKKKYEI